MIDTVVPVRYPLSRSSPRTFDLAIEVAREGDAVDLVVIGHKQASRWRRAVRRIFGGSDVEGYLREHPARELVTVGPE